MLLGTKLHDMNGSLVSKTIIFGSSDPVGGVSIQLALSRHGLLMLSLHNCNI